MAKSKTDMRPPVYGGGGLLPQPWVDRGNRTNNRLIRGPKVDIPATVGLEVDPVQTINKSFTYRWTHDWDTASEGNILIAKGNMIAFNDNGLIEFADFDAADQTAYPAGLSYLNLFKPVADRLAANRPGLAVRGYFELPVFASYADAAAAGHKWGAVLAYGGSLLPGDTLRMCGNSTDGALSPGWFTNANNNNTAKLAPYQMAGAQDNGIIAQCLEFDEGPTFDGLLEWVQFDNPFEFEDPESFWRNGDANRHGWRDPDSPTGFSFGPEGSEGMYPYDPRLQDPWFRDAAGIPNLSDGTNWEVVSSEKLTLPAGPVTANYYLYYYAFGSVGALLEADGSVWADNVAEVYLNEALTTTLTGSTFNAGLITVNSVSDDGAGTLTMNITYAAAGTGGSQTLYVKAKGQVAGVPVNIDIAKCVGLARFQLLLR